MSKKKPARPARPIKAKRPTEAPRPKRGRRRPSGPPRPPVPTSELTVVGVGASAGGLEAFSQVLRNLPHDGGLAVVFVQHLAPQHDSALVTLLTAQTAM